MKKLEPKQIAALAALTVGAMVIGKIAKDVKKICQMANEKEEILPDADEEIAPAQAEVIEADVIEEAPVAEEILEVAETPVAAETANTETATVETITE